MCKILPGPRVWYTPRAVLVGRLADIGERLRAAIDLHDHLWWTGRKDACVQAADRVIELMRVRDSLVQKLKRVEKRVRDTR